MRKNPIITHKDVATYPLHLNVNEGPTFVIVDSSDLMLMKLPCHKIKIRRTYL